MRRGAEVVVREDGAQRPVEAQIVEQGVGIPALEGGPCAVVGGCPLPLRNVGAVEVYFVVVWMISVV